MKLFRSNLSSMALLLSATVVSSELTGDHGMLRQEERRRLNEGGEIVMCDGQDVVDETALPKSSPAAWCTYLVATSGSDALKDRTSPQSKATKWIANDDTYFVSAPGADDKVAVSKAIQRYSMGVLYFALMDGRTEPLVVGNATLGTEEWLSSDHDVCDWKGVRCSDGMVSEINLGENQLTGELPVEIGRLTDLETLDLYGNSIGGAIPGTLGAMKGLKFLDLSMNQLVGRVPEGMYGIQTLEKVYLSDNMLTGSISKSIGGMDGLVDVRLDNNKLSGSIPYAIGGLRGTRYIVLRNNKLTGRIPAGIFKTRVVYLDLSLNELSGTIPLMIGGAGRMKHLFLNDNKLSGPIPKEIGDLEVKLRSLYLNNNELTGYVPAEMGNLGKLNALQLQNNNITSPFDDDICDLAKDDGDLASLEADCTVCTCRYLCASCNVGNLMLQNVFPDE